VPRPLAESTDQVMTRQVPGSTKCCLAPLADNGARHLFVVNRT
jgi:hypothetical protein